VAPVPGHGSREERVQGHIRPSEGQLRVLQPMGDGDRCRVDVPTPASARGGARRRRPPAPPGPHVAPPRGGDPGWRRRPKVREPSEAIERLVEG